MRTRDDKILPLTVAIAVLCAHAAFIFIQRSPVRTVYPHYILGILLLLLLIDYSKFRVIRKREEIKHNEQGQRNIAGTTMLGIFLGITILVNTGLADASFAWQRQNYAYFKQLDHYISENKDKVYLSSVYAGSERFKAYSVFDAPEKGMFENFCLLGGWYTKSPKYFAFIKEYALDDNLFLSLLKDNVYLIEKGEPDLIQQYLSDDYQIETEALMVAEFDDIGVYKLHRIVD